MSQLVITSFIERILPEYERVRLYFLGKVGCEHDASDLVQETFARLLRWRPTTEVVHPERVLFRTAHNLLIDRFRSARQVRLEPWDEAREEEFLDPGLDPAHKAVVAEQLRMVAAAVGELPEMCRKVFVMNRFLGISHEKISSLLSISTSTVERCMVRAILSCKRALKELD